ncbi:MAG: CCA tRNA nucleotidyltransferase [Magnetococcales bacterium]|nr:CCA tRNA nucleotidyltransferase [Magnetococcales bacterium]
MKSLLQSNFSPYVCQLLDSLNRLIGPIHLVGRVLRQALRNDFAVREIDLLVASSLSLCHQKLLEGGFPQVVMGKRHNSLLLPLKGDTPLKIIHISTLRHRPGHQATVEEDLLHRDITFNAMAFPWPDGKLIDPFGGQQDLQENRVRLVNGSDTLREEPLKALRFYRFIMQFAAESDPRDLELTEQTHLGRVSQERLRAEMDRFLSLPLTKKNSVALMRRFFNSPLGEQILPELATLKEVRDTNGDTRSAWEKSLDMMFAVSRPREGEKVSLLDLRWAALLHLVGKTACVIAPEDSVTPAPLLPGQMEETLRLVDTILERLHFSKRRQQRLHRLIAHLEFDDSPSDRALKRLIENDIPIEGLFRLIKAKRETQPNLVSAELERMAAECHRTLRRCQAISEAQNRLSPDDLAISGGELLDLVRQKPGAWIGQLQEWLVDQVTENPQNNRREVLEKLIREWIAQHGLPS